MENYVVIEVSEEEKPKLVYEGKDKKVAMERTNHIDGKTYLIYNFRRDKNSLIIDKTPRINTVLERTDTILLSGQSVLRGLAKVLEEEKLEE